MARFSFTSAFTYFTSRCPIHQTCRSDCRWFRIRLSCLRLSISGISPEPTTMKSCHRSQGRTSRSLSYRMRGMLPVQCSLLREDRLLSVLPMSK